MKKKVFLIALVAIIAVVGVFALSACSTSSEEFSPFRDKLPDNPDKEGVVGYTFNPAACYDENKNNVFDGVEKIKPWVATEDETSDYKAQKAFPLTHVGSVYSEEAQEKFEDTYPVIGISSNAFYGVKTLKEVVLPDSYYIIGTYAFFDCSNLEKIVLPAGLKEIRQWAFYGCSGLKEIYFRGTEDQWNKLLTVKDNGKRDVNTLGNDVIEKMTKNKKVVFEYVGTGEEL